MSRLLSQDMSGIRVQVVPPTSCLGGGRVAAKAPGQWMHMFRPALFFRNNWSSRREVKCDDAMFVLLGPSVYQGHFYLAENYSHICTSNKDHTHIGAQRTHVPRRAILYIVAHQLFFGVYSSGCYCRWWWWELNGVTDIPHKNNRKHKYKSSSIGKAERT